MKKKLTCCICGKQIETMGNNPAGATDETGKIIYWDTEHVCCDKCNIENVIPGRIMRMSAQHELNNIEFKTAEEAINKLRNLESSGKITNILYNFILANWNELLKNKE